jgi:hypothetical protein
MRFDDLYPSTSGFQRASDGFARGAGATAECVNCGRQTHWFHRNIALYFCSTECFGQFRGDRPGLTQADPLRRQAAKRRHDPPHNRITFFRRWPFGAFRPRRST